MATPQQNEPRYNERIRAREVRLIGADGSQVGIKTLPEALSMARQLDLDLVEVAPLANPPVCRIMDYGKFRYEESQKAKESRKKTIHVSIKEVKLRPKIGKGDLDTKVRHMQEFLSEGHKVKVTLQFRGREMAHPELGSRLLDTVIAQVDGLGKVETQARLEGRNMTMVLAPEKKAPVKKERTSGEAKSATDEAADTGSGDGDLPVEAEAQDSQPEQTQAPEAEPVVEEQAVEAAGDAV
ncbi:MAG: translation initiation factor IF-3 [Actinobacteria bacterium]|nr:translation initiation factor IF-3 [Actinomycetota bacterium]